MKEPIIIKHKQHSTDDYKYIKGGLCTITLRQNVIESFEKSEAEVKKEEGGTYTQRFYNHVTIPKHHISAYEMYFDNNTGGFRVEVFGNNRNIVCEFSEDEMESAEEMLEKIDNWYNENY